MIGEIADNLESGRSNRNLNRASVNRNDEFYTRFEEIERELVHYKPHFKGSVVFCNCDDPKEAENLKEGSHFWNYFYKNFEHLELRKLITTHYLPPEAKKRTYKLEYTGKGKPRKTPLKQNGNFLSDECIGLLSEADIVCTNPPFSKLREYVAQLMEHKKRFLIIGNLNAVSYKEIFPLFQNNEIWLGVKERYDRDLIVPSHLIDENYNFRYDEKGNAIANVSMVMWFTNLSHKRRNEDIICFREYTPEE